MRAAIRLLLLSKLKSLVQRIADLFRNGEQGVWYDPSDFTRYMSSLGPELVVNGTFDTDTSGWVATVGTISAPSGSLIVTDSAAFGGRATSSGMATVIGRSYKVTADILAADVSNIARLRITNSSDGAIGGEIAGATHTAPVTSATLVFTATATTTYLAAICFTSSVGKTVTFDNISVKELTAISTATMFQDSAGTTPVTAVEQPVGLILDKSKGLVLGAELVVNGGFDTDTGWTKGATAPGTSVISGGKLTIVSPAGEAANATQTILTIGRTYKITGSVTVRSGSAKVDIGATTTFSTTQSFTTHLTATTTSFYIGRNGACDADFDNISVKELPGNAAKQATSTKRPLLSARYNLLTKTEQFDDAAAWAKQVCFITANAATAPDGVTSADKLVMNNGVNPSGSTSDGMQTLIALPITGRYILSIFAKAAELSVIRFRENVATGSFLDVNLTTGAITNGSTPQFISPSAVAYPNGWWKISFSSANTMSNTNKYLIRAASIGDGTSGIYIWGASLVPTDQAELPYQRVNTSTDYDTVGFKPYLKFDGVDDALATSSIDFSSTDKMTVCAGVRKLSDAAVAILAELSADTNGNTGTFYVVAPPNSSLLKYGFLSKGTMASSAVPTVNYLAPTTNVLTGVASILSDVCTLRINGTQAAISATDQGTGNFGNYPIFIGSRAGTSLPFNGQIYSLLIRGAASTASQIASAEAYVAQKTGVAL